MAKQQVEDAKSNVDQLTDEKEVLRRELQYMKDNNKAMSRFYRTNEALTSPL